MNKKLVGTGLVLVPLMVGGVMAANQIGKTDAQTQVAEEYTCPLTGDVLPCPNCCPLNKAAK